MIHMEAGLINLCRPFLKSSGRPVGLLVAGFTKTWTEDPVVQAKESKWASLGSPKKKPSLRSQ